MIDSIMYHEIMSSESIDEIIKDWENKKEYIDAYKSGYINEPSCHTKYTVYSAYLKTLDCIINEREILKYCTAKDITSVSIVERNESTKVVLNMSQKEYPYSFFESVYSILKKPYGYQKNNTEVIVRFKGRRNIKLICDQRIIEIERVV